MKVRLLNGGCYRGLEEVQFPVVVEAEVFEKDGYGYAEIPRAELERIGARMECFNALPAYNFMLDGDNPRPMGLAEIVEE